MAIFEINTNGKSSVKDKIKDFYQMLIGGVVAYSLLLLAFRYTVDNKGYLTFLTIFITALYIFVFVIIPITLKIRINKVIREIQIKERQILITTNKEYEYAKENISFKEVQNRFTGFSIINKSGILLKTNEGKEFWLIEDFYSDFEELKQSLTTARDVPK